MSAGRTIRKRRKEAGIALLIAIFILLLIGVVAIALMVSSGTESALAGNYRSSTSVYYAAVAGLEEVRGRLRSSNPNSFNTTAPGFLPPPGTTLPIGSISYVLNPSPTENIGNILATYPDTEYDTEFGANALNNANNAGKVQTTASIWNRAPLNGLGAPGPYYKWVRINAISEVSLRLNVSPFNDPNDAVTPIFSNGSQLNVSNSGLQVFEITSLAVLPDGSRKILQYLATAQPVTLPPFPAALTLAGSASSNVVAYSAPASNSAFWINGNDHDCSGAVTGTPFPAVGVFNNADIPVVTSGGTVNGVIYSGIPVGYRPTNYPGKAASPDVELVNGIFPATLTTPSGLDAVVQMIIQNADAVIPTGSNAVQTSFLSSLVSSGKMSATSPLTLIVNGDLDLTGWHNTGYGLLLVTGNLNHDPDTTWDGIVMVVGQGTVTGSKAGTGGFNGAILVARTRDAAGALLGGSSLGYSYVNFNNGGSMGGNGISYSSCWVQKSQPTFGFKVLSFHEIAQQ